MSSRPVPVWAGDAAMGMALAAVGAAFTVLSAPIPRGEVGNPGPGFFPFVLGLALMGLGMGSAVRAWRARRSAGTVSLGNRKALVCVLAMAASAVAFVPLGFVPTTAVFLAVLFWALGSISWWKAAAVAVVSSALLWVVFDRLLGVLLPAGVLPP